MPITPTNPFKGRQHSGEVIILCVRWYLLYPLAYEHVAELLAERGVEVDPSCIWRWVQVYAPELNKRCRPYLKPTNKSYRTDETYIKVKGEDRTGAANASGSRRKAHNFAHGKLRGRAVRRTNPSTLWRWTSGNRPVPIPRTLCLAHSHCRSLLPACCSTAR